MAMAGLQNAIAPEEGADGTDSRSSQEPRRISYRVAGFSCLAALLLLGTLSQRKELPAVKAEFQDLGLEVRMPRAASNMSLADDGPCKVAGCAECPESPDDCQVCKSGFVRLEILGMCLPCAEHCFDCGEKGAFKCDRDSCESRYVEQDGLCLPCAPHCSECKVAGASKCDADSCDFPYVEQDGLCSVPKFLWIPGGLCAAGGFCFYCYNQRHRLRFAAARQALLNAHPGVRGEPQAAPPLSDETLRASAPPLVPTIQREPSSGSSQDGHCAICFEQPINARLQPCNHRMCHQCASQLPARRCPFCRRDIQNILREPCSGSAWDQS